MHRPTLFTLTAMALALVPLQAQEPSTEELVEAAADVMRSARFCTLITLDEDGHPRARVMDPFEPEKGLVVWMATNADTRKVEDLRRDPRATLHYFDTEGIGYVTLQGEILLIEDPERKALHWKPDWKNFYQDEYRGRDYLLLRFVPRRLEIVSHTHGIASDAMAWRPAVLELLEPVETRN